MAPSDIFDAVISGAYSAAAANPRRNAGPGPGLGTGKLPDARTSSTAISSHGTAFRALIQTPAGPEEPSAPPPLPVCRRGTLSCFGDIMQVPPDVQRVVLETLMSPQQGDSGLRDAARLGIACRGWWQAYRGLLLADVGLSIKVKG